MTEQIPLDISKIQIVLAQADEAETVLDILSEAASFIQLLGIDQWPDRFPKDLIDKGIGSTEIWLAKAKETPVGTFALTWSDPDIWPNVSDDAGYLHRLATKRAYSGNSLGAYMIKHAEQEVTRRRKSFLRLDCIDENPGLNEYYRIAGFELVGHWQGPWKGTFRLMNLYQKEIHDKS